MTIRNHFAPLMSSPNAGLILVGYRSRLADGNELRVILSDSEDMSIISRDYEMPFNHCDTVLSTMKFIPEKWRADNHGIIMVLENELERIFHIDPHRPMTHLDIGRNLREFTECVMGDGRNFSFNK